MGLSANAGHGKARREVLAGGERPGTVVPALPVAVGGREWLALPDFGIACIQGRLLPDAAESTLGVLDVALSAEAGAGQVRFFIRPIPGDDRTIVVAEAVLVETPPAGGWPREPLIRTLVTLGEETWPIELRLVPQQPRRVRLTLGGRALGDRFAVRAKKSFLAGPPSPSVPRRFV